MNFQKYLISDFTLQFGLDWKPKKQIVNIIKIKHQINLQNFTRRKQPNNEHLYHLDVLEFVNDLYFQVQILCSLLISVQ